VATVNKNFRVKNGLVVEGNTATVNGYDILTKASADQSYIIDLIGGTATSANTANTVVKRDASGNFSAGTITATFSGNLTGDVTGTVSSLSNHDTGDLTEGSNLYFTDTRAKESAADLLVNATKTNIQITGDENGLTITAENGVADSTTDDLAEGSTRLYFTTSRAREAISGGTGISYNDSTGVVSVDNTIATKTYADNAASNAVNALSTDDIEEGSSNVYFTNGRARNAVSAGTGITYSSADGVISVTSGTYDAYGAASTAEGNANTYTDNAINALTTDDIEEGSSNKYYSDSLARAAVSAGSGLDYNSSTGEFSVDTTTIANKSYVDTAISNLVDGAPGLLDTLNEIAAAINDDANYFTTVANSIAGKLALAGGTMTGTLVLASDPVNALEAATKQYVDSAQSAAQSAAESTAQGALNDVLDGTTDFTALDVNSVSRQIAATTGNIVTAAATTAISWAKADYRTAKILVKAKNGSHTHVSEVIVTLDTSDNIALNEYAITTTNGPLMTIDADINSGSVRLRVTPENNNTEVIAHATLLV
jgi:hypothetical protein